MRRALRLSTLGRHAQQAGKQGATIGAAMGGLDEIFRVRHQAKHVLACIEDAGNVAQRAIGIGALGIAEGDLAFTGQSIKCR